MNKEDSSSNFAKIGELIIRKWLENIDSPFVYSPLGLFVLSILAFPLTDFAPFLYLAVGFLVLMFSADWLGRLRNRKPVTIPTVESLDQKPQLDEAFAKTQEKAVRLFEQGKVDAARELTENNLKQVREVLKKYPDNLQLRIVLGYTLKDAYQTLRGKLPQSQRAGYLHEARRAFEQALAVAPNDPSVHNGMGNVLFFEGNYDAAINKHNTALELAGGYYPAAEHDKDLVQRVKAGKINFTP